MCTRPNYMLYTGIKPSSKKLVKQKLWQFVGHHQFKDMIKNGDDFVEVPCGQCLECRLQHARSWADRCVLEAKKSEHNYFLTLTYDDEHLPVNGSLDFEHLTRFIKRLRKHYEPTKIKYFACGEYSPNWRPHWHIILFNCPIEDLTRVFERFEDGRYKKHIFDTKAGSYMYSRTIYDLWREGGEHFGQIVIAPFSYDTAAYVSQYVTKKVNPKLQQQYYELNITPEGIRMSQGIAKDFFNADYFINNDTMIIPDAYSPHIVSIPRYYEKLFVKEFGALPLDVIKRRFNKKIQNNIDFEAIRNVDFKDQQNDARDYRITGLQKIRDNI